MNCPTSEEWIRRSLEARDAAASRAMQQHLSSCESCRRVVEEIASDDERLADAYAGVDAGVDYESRYDEMLSALSSMTDSAATARRGEGSLLAAFWRARLAGVPVVILISAILLLLIAAYVVYRETTDLPPFLYPFF